jgi:hypothetical protein
VALGLLAEGGSIEKGDAVPAGVGLEGEAMVVAGFGQGRRREEIGGGRPGG